MALSSASVVPYSVAFMMVSVSGGGLSRKAIILAYKTSSRWPARRGSDGAGANGKAGRGKR